jgi:osmotically-inducible protein OsmY
MVTVEGGWVRLQGSVEWEYQKNVAGTAVKNLKDAEGVFNSVEVKDRAAIQSCLRPRNKNGVIGSISWGKIVILANGDGT